MPEILRELALLGDIVNRFVSRIKSWGVGFVVGLLDMGNQRLAGISEGFILVDENDFLCLEP